MMRRSWAHSLFCATPIALAASLGCAGKATPITGRPSPLPTPPNVPTLQAGAAQRDITPPPGYGMMGWGPEGPAATGHRQRLHARALVLKDRQGESIAFVGIELGMPSVLLQREVARRIESTTGIGPDRLVLAATHTHSAPSSYFGNPAYDKLGSNVPGFDPRLVEFLSARISDAILAAHASLRPAEAAWASDTIWDVSRVRSFASYRTNERSVREAMLFSWDTPARLSPERAGVDPTFWMLRVDTLDRANVKHPLAAMSIFALHGTVIPSSNDLYDSDVHGYVSTVLERKLRSTKQPSAPTWHHLFLNGAEGDASPAYDGRTRCAPPIITRTRIPGPNASHFTIGWSADPRAADRNSECVALAVAETRRIGTAIALRAERLFRSLATTLSGDLTIARAFTTVSVSYDRDEILCRPTGGVAQVAGVGDGWARIIHWPLMFLQTSAPDSLTTAAHPFAIGCHGYKRRFLGPAQPIVAGKRPLPNSIQLSVLRIGDQWLATVPAEPTTHSGWTIKRAIADRIGLRGKSAERIAVVGLTNGYTSYVTTPSEYRVQSYEGGATIFGPRTLQLTRDTLAHLAQLIYENNGSSVHPKTILPIWTWVLSEENIGHIADCRAPPVGGSRSDPTTVWVGDSLVTEWTDRDPGYVYACTPAPWFVVERATPPDTVFATDGEIDVEVGVRKISRARWRYRARWWPANRPADSVRVRFMSR